MAHWRDHLQDYAVVGNGLKGLALGFLCAVYFFCKDNLLNVIQGLALWVRSSRDRIPEQEIRKVWDEAGELSSTVAMMSEPGYLVAGLMVLLSCVLFGVWDGLRERKIRELRKESDAHARRLEEAHRRLTETQRRLAHSERLAAIGRMAAGVSHEINNPLAAVAGHVRLLAMQLPPNDPRFPLVEVMQKETLRIRNIVRGLNDFARHQPDPDEILKNTTDVHRILEETLEAFQIQLTEKQMEVVREFRAAPAEVFGKKDHLRMAFTNLISNAVEASREKSLIRLRTSSSILDRASAMALRSYEAHGGTSGTAPGAQRVLGLQEEFSLPQILKEGDRIVRIDVCDHGSGISPELLGKIFEPFVTTKDVGYGLGLGLAITYSIIRSHGGFIEVESEVGRGSRFSVVLAAARPLPLPGRVNDHPPASTPSLT